MIEYFAQTTGRYFVVGDIHGCFKKLESELKSVKFDKTCDHLFCVGDLVDRGQESIRAIEFLLEPWFHSVRGNHEQMAIEYSEGLWHTSDYIQNGGKWFVDLEDTERKIIIDAVNKLPYVMELSLSSGDTVGIVHAECLYNSWEVFCSNIEAEDKMALQTCLWGRTVVKNQLGIGQVFGIDRIYVGHTPVKTPAVVGNHYYIDTGAVFGKRLTLLELI